MCAWAMAGVCLHVSWLCSAVHVLLHVFICIINIAILFNYSKLGNNPQDLILLLLSGRVSPHLHVHICMFL